MPSQTRRRAAPSATLMMPATGAVCPRKKAAVAEANIKGSEAHTALPSHPAFQIRLAMLVANAIMLTLNSICSTLNLLPDFGQHCTTVETHAMKTASSALKFTTAMSRKGKLTDMLPSMPGSLIFMREVAAASASTVRAKAGCSVWLARPANRVLAIAARTISPMKVCVSRVFGFIILSSLWFSSAHGYCSSSPASENAASALVAVAPQTTLVACVPVPVLDPQTTLKAPRRLLFQGNAVPQTTELPLTFVPQTTDVPHTTEVPQTTEDEATLLF